MPFAVPFIATGFEAIGVTGSLTIAGSTVTYATIAAQATIALASLGASYELNKLLAPKQQASAPPDNNVTSRMERPPRRYIGGRQSVGAYEGFVEAVPANQPNCTVRQILVHCDGPITAVEQTFLDDIPVGFDPARVGDADGGGGEVLTPDQWRSGGLVVARLDMHLGTTTQTADPFMLESFPGIWTTAHQLKGIFYTHAYWISGGATNFQKIYRGGRPPSVRHVVRGLAAFDPRDGSQAAGAPTSWKWTRNAACQIVSHLLRPELNGGMGLPANLLNLASFAAFADICDQVIAHADGSFERRWCLDPIWYSTDDPKDVLKKLQDGCAAEVYEDNAGLLAIRGGRYEAPNFAFADADIVSCELERGPDVFTALNYAKVNWLSMDNAWTMSEAAPVTNATLIAAAGRNVVDTLEYEFVTQHHQARRLAQIEMNRRNQGWRGKITTTLAAVTAWNDATMTISLSFLGISSQAFRIANRSLAGDGDSIEWEVVATASSDWSEPSQVAPPALAPATDNNSRVPMPYSATVTRNGGTGVTNFGVAAPQRGDMYVRVRSWRDGEATLTSTVTQGGTRYALSGTFRDQVLAVGVTDAQRNDLSAGTVVGWLITYITQDMYETEYALNGQTTL